MITDVSGPSPFRRPRPLQHRTRMLAAAVAVVAVGAIGFAGQAYGSSGSHPLEIQVQPHDTLWSIALHTYGSAGDIQAEVAAIIQINHLNGGLITPGEELTLPPV